jgi:uncharacterized protein (TIGR02452 family)
MQRLLAEVLSQPTASTPVVVEIEIETTLAGITRLLNQGSAPVAALNFASAKNPGGGFLSGSQAQEESLARSSALYASLTKVMAFYEHHRGQGTPLYTHAMILSPDCPVFRDDSGALLSSTQRVTFISSAAPNAGALKDRYPHEFNSIPEVLKTRAEYVLALAASQGLKHLVLGAWGCGVFRNDPHLVAQTFMQLLSRDEWRTRFSKVVFSIPDSSPNADVVQIFRVTGSGETPGSYRE